jgi:hypothetical protein
MNETNKKRLIEKGHALLNRANAILNDVYSKCIADKSSKKADNINLNKQ